MKECSGNFDWNLYDNFAWIFSCIYRFTAKISSRIPSTVSSVIPQEFCTGIPLAIPAEKCHSGLFYSFLFFPKKSSINFLWIFPSNFIRSFFDNFFFSNAPFFLEIFVTLRNSNFLHSSILLKKSSPAWMSEIMPF